MITIDGPVRFEHHTEPLGIGESAPRISWRTRAKNGFRQRAYELEAIIDGHTVCVREESADQVLVPWPFRQLHSREQVSVRVRVISDDGDISPWSQSAHLETGLLDAAQWKAQAIAAPWSEDPDSDRRPPIVRKSFRVDGEIVSARLYVTAHGVYETEINGHRIGDEILSPGWTVYSDRLRYRTFDVTEALTPGDNAIGAWLADGWYRGRLGFGGGSRNLYGQDLSLIAQLEIMLADGRRQQVVSDDSWKAAFGPIRYSGLYEGETYVAGDEQPGWSSPAFDDSEWRDVATRERDPKTLVAPDGPPVRCTEELQPVSVRTLSNGRVLLDFGQNLVGRLRVNVNGLPGTTITMRHAEVLQEGTLFVRPLRGAAATDTLVLDGNGTKVWEPKFTIHGFRYAEIDGWPGQFPDDGDSPVTARVYHTDMQRTGWFSSSNELLNRLHENVVWSMRGNFVDIPTDCPQRDERLGWTGDIQVFAPTASFLYDCAGMLSSWLKDLAVEQHDDGTVPWYVPVIPGGAQWTPVEPGAAWGDAAVIVPWTLFERFGDTGVLRQQYRSAKAWVDLVAQRAGEDYLWNSGKQLGDWLDPTAPPTEPHRGKTDPYLVATAYFAHSAKRLSDAAEVLGYSEDSRHYADLSDKVKQAFVAEYGGDLGIMSSDSETAYALALVFDLLPDGDARSSAGRRLVELVADSGYRIATGFVGTPLVTDALSMTGHEADAYKLLLQQECPSWLYTVLQGGTTIWERWDSMLPDGSVNPGEMTSFNHYALGSVADWMHRVIAGLAPLEPGYRRVSISPRPGGDLTWAQADHDSPYGRISVGWQLDGSDLLVTATLPPGTIADVRIPGRPPEVVGSGKYSFTGSISQSRKDRTIYVG